ncbi:Lrp/AsnC family transcriptional regulator [Sphaerothrix gracilis]|uniref:Lrp/AsnC family transcriptional regulator n=1 Tax=Sphaerothrix gracilis TaxID=3151835 RepID=UPI0031FD9360
MADRPPLEMSEPLDLKDRQVLRLLQENGRITLSELARQVNLSAPGLQKRLKKLEENRVIDRYVTVINRQALGLHLLCFMQVTLTAQPRPQEIGQFCDRIQDLPEVLECHHLTGELEYLLKIVVADHQHLENFLFEKITQIPAVDRVQTRIVINEVKASTSLPLT